MKTTFLEFEQPIAELETRIEELRYVQDDSAVDISEEIQRLTGSLLRCGTGTSKNIIPAEIGEVR